MLSALLDFLPKTQMREKFHNAIHEALNKHLACEISYNLEAISQQEFGSFCDHLSDPSILMILGMPPREGKIILEIDDHLAVLFIERLLGGTANPPPRILSDTEQGVLQYLILQVLSHLYRLCGHDARLHFRFEKFCFSPNDIRQITLSEEIVSVLTVKLTCDANDGFLKLAFPSPLIEQLYLNVEAKGEIRTSERDYMWNNLSELGRIQVPLWAEAGYTTITAQDMRNLEKGDVILFDMTNLTLEESGPSGRAILRAGEGTHGGFLAEIKTEPKKVKCRIVDVYKGEDIL